VPSTTRLADVLPGTRVGYSWSNLMNGFKRFRFLRSACCAPLLSGAVVLGPLMTAVLVSAQPITSVPVSVPGSMRTSPFDVPRRWNVPTGFIAEVYARLERPRFMAFPPSGDLLVSQPARGRVWISRPGQSTPVQSIFAQGLKSPHDLVFHVLDGVTSRALRSSG
jgi:hypothetical protein